MRCARLGRRLAQLQLEPFVRRYEPSSSVEAVRSRAHLVARPADIERRHRRFVLPPRADRLDARARRRVLEYIDRLLMKPRTKPAMRSRPELHHLKGLTPVERQTDPMVHQVNVSVLKVMAKITQPKHPRPRHRESRQRAFNLETALDAGSGVGNAAVNFVASASGISDLGRARSKDLWASAYSPSGNRPGR